MKTSRPGPSGSGLRRSIIFSSAMAKTYPSATRRCARSTCTWSNMKRGFVRNYRAHRCRERRRSRRSFNSRLCEPEGPAMTDGKKVMFEIFREREDGAYRVVYFTELTEHEKDDALSEAMQGSHIYSG